MTATHRRARKHAPHPSGRAGLPGRATSHPIARAHRPSWLALDSLACTGPCSIHDPRSRRPPPSATPSPTPTRRSSRQILASAPPGDTATHTRASSHPPTPRPRCTARPAPPVTLERLSWTKPPARAHLLRPPRQPCLPAPPPGGQTHGCPPTLELYSPLAPHNATPLPRTRATPTACHRGTTPHAFTAACPPATPIRACCARPGPPLQRHRAHLLRRTQTRPHSPLPAWVRFPGPSQPRHPQQTQAGGAARSPLLRPRHSGNGGAARRTGHCVVCENSRRALEGLFSAPYTRKQNGVRTRAPGPPLRPTPADTANRTRTRALRPVPPLTHPHTQTTLQGTPCPYPRHSRGYPGPNHPPAPTCRRPPHQPCLPAPPPSGRTHDSPHTLELYSPVGPHNATPLPRTRAGPATCRRDTTPHAFHRSPPPATSIWACHARPWPPQQRHRAHPLQHTHPPSRPPSPRGPTPQARPGSAPPNGHRLDAPPTRPYCAPGTAATGVQPAKRSPEVCVHRRRSRSTGA